MPATRYEFPSWQTPAQRRAQAEIWRRNDESVRTLNRALAFFRLCRLPGCRRAGDCKGDVHICFARHWALVPASEKARLRQALEKCARDAGRTTART
jgi:hypothetical protein